MAAGTRWMKRVKDATKLPEGVLSVQLFVPDMFGNDVLLTRQDIFPILPRNVSRSRCHRVYTIFVSYIAMRWQYIVVQETFLPGAKSI